MATGFVTHTSEIKKKFQGLLLAIVVAFPAVSSALDSDLESLTAKRWHHAYMVPTQVINRILERASDPKQRLVFIAELNPIIKTTDLKYVKETHQKLVEAQELLKLPFEQKTLIDINQAAVVNFWTNPEVRKYFAGIWPARRDQVSLEALSYILYHTSEFSTVLTPALLHTMVTDYYLRSLKAGTLTGKDALQLSEVLWRDVLRGNEFPGIRYNNISEEPAFVLRHEILKKAAELDREPTLLFCKEKFARFLRYTRRSTFATKDFENGMPRSAWQEGQVYSSILAHSSNPQEFSELLKDISAEADRLMLDFDLDSNGNKSPTYVFAETVGSEMIRMLKSQRPPE